MPEQAGKIQPQNIEAERSLLGALMLDKDILFRVLDVAKEADFYLEKHRNIYNIILELSEKNEAVDLLTVSARLEEKKQLEDSGGKSYLAELTNSVPSTANAVNYARIIHKKATLRRLLSASARITELGFDEEHDLEAILDEAQQKLFNVSSNFLKAAFTPIRSVLANTFERIDEMHKNKGEMRGIPSGYVALDNILAGFQKSDLVILAARPSVGKTSLALDIMRHAAVKQKKAVGMFSLEMSKEQLVDRLLCAQANVDLWRMRTGRLSDKPEDDDFPRIGHAMGILSESPIFIDDTPNVNIMQIRAKARRLQTEHGLSMIVVDYLQLMEGRGKSSSENRVQEIAEISRGLKGIARELNIPVLALSQLSRAVESTKPAIPKLSHLRDSGSIEQDADVVIFLYRKAADRNYRLEDIPPDERRIGEVHVAKHRNGPTGMVKLIFDAERASFRNMERQHMPAPNTPQPSKTPQF